MAAMTTISGLDSAILDWLLEPEDPGVRHLALRDLLRLDPADPELVAARAAAMRTDPIASILAAQHPEGYWVKPGAGYGPKYSGTTWQVVFLEQLGADGDDPRVRAACDYLIGHTQSTSGGFGYKAGERVPPPSTVVHCLNGNLVRALVRLGWAADPRVQRAIAWEAEAVTGEGNMHFNAATPGPGFRCGVNGGEPCGWGAAKGLLGLAAVPSALRTPAVERAIALGVEFLLSVDPSTAMYPMSAGNTRPNSSWFKLGFPLGYVADVLQVLEALVEAGAAGDPRLARAVEWLLGQRDRDGRWRNRYSYAGKLVKDIDRQGQPSKWVTLRACRVLRAVGEANAPL